MRKLGLVAILTTLITLPPAARAHHSFDMFNMDETDTVIGTVTEWRWQNPHSWLALLVTKPDGTQGHYNFESRPIYLLIRMRVAPFTLTPGQVVTIAYNPFRDGDKGGFLVTARGQDGRLLIPRNLPKPVPGGGAAATAAEPPQ